LQTPAAHPSSCSASLLLLLPLLLLSDHQSPALTQTAAAADRSSCSPSLLLLPPVSLANRQP
jgi:hypothetical protein